MKLHWFFFFFFELKYSVQFTNIALILCTLCSVEAEIQGHEEDTCTKESVHENDQASTNRGTQPDLGIDKGYIDTDIKPGKMEQEGYAEMDTPVEDITKDEHGRFFSNLEQADENDLVHGMTYWGHFLGIGSVTLYHMTRAFNSLPHSPDP